MNVHVAAEGLSVSEASLAESALVRPADTNVVFRAVVGILARRVGGGVGGVLVDFHVEISLPAGLIQGI